MYPKSSTTYRLMCHRRSSLDLALLLARVLLVGREASSVACIAFGCSSCKWIDEIVHGDNGMDMPQQPGSQRKQAHDVHHFMLARWVGWQVFVSQPAMVALKCWLD